MHDKPNVNITIYLIRLKIESNKKHICYCFFFVFIKRKMLLMYTELFVRRIMKSETYNVIIIRTLFRNGDISDKKRFRRCKRGRIVKRWEKVMENHEK